MRQSSAPSITNQTPRLCKSSIQRNIAAIRHMRYKDIRTVVANVVSRMAIHLPLVARDVVQRDVAVRIAESYHSIDEFGGSRILSLEKTERIVHDLRALAVARDKEFGLWALRVGLDDELKSIEVSGMTSHSTEQATHIRKILCAGQTATKAIFRSISRVVVHTLRSHIL